MKSQVFCIGGGVLTALLLISLFFFGCSGGSSSDSNSEQNISIPTAYPENPNTQTPPNTNDDNDDDDNDDDDDDDGDGDEEELPDGDVDEINKTADFIFGATIWVNPVNYGAENDLEGYKITMRFPDDRKVNVSDFLDKIVELKRRVGSTGTVEAVYPTNWSNVVLSGGLDLEKFEALKNTIFGDIDAKLANPQFDGNTLPTLLDFVVRSDVTSGVKKNIFGKDIDKIAKLYYTKGAKERYNQFVNGEHFVFDANEDGKGERVYGEDGSLGNPYNVDVAFALLNPSLHLKNVKITGSSDSSYGEDFPNLTNVYVASDVDYVKGVGRSEGIVEFAGLPPQQTPLMNDGKLIINKTNGNKVGIKHTKVLELGDVGVDDFTTPGGDIAQNIGVDEVYYRNGVVGKVGGTKAIYYKDGSDWKQRWQREGYEPLGLNHNNSWWEDKGNGK